MARKATNTVSIRGVRELASKIQEIVEDVQIGDVYKIVGDAGEILKSQVKANVAPLSSRVAASVHNIHAANSHSRRLKKKSALVFVDKKPTMVEWRAAPNNKSPRAKVSPGNKMAMSLATMLEIGTSRGIPAHAYFGNAIKQSRSAIKAKLQDGVNELLKKHTRNPSKPRD